MRKTKVRKGKGLGGRSYSLWVDPTDYWASLLFLTACIIPGWGPGWVSAEKSRLSPEILGELRRKWHLSLAVKAQSTICGGHTKSFENSFSLAALLSDESAPTFSPLPPASALSPNSPVSLLLPFFHSRVHSPARVSNLIWPILMSFEGLSESGPWPGQPFPSPLSSRSWLPRTFGMRPPPWCTLQCFLWWVPLAGRQTQPLPKRFRHSVLGMLRSPLEVRLPCSGACGLARPFLFAYQYSAHLPRPLCEPSQAFLPLIAPSSLHPVTLHAHSTQRQSHGSQVASDPTCCPHWYLPRTLQALSNGNSGNKQEWLPL